jgi:hypothetical protein
MGPYINSLLAQAADEKHHLPTQDVAQVSQAKSPENQQANDGEHVMNNENDSGKDTS